MRRIAATLLVMIAVRITHLDDGRILVETREPGRDDAVQTEGINHG